MNVIPIQQSAAIAPLPQAISNAFPEDIPEPSALPHLTICPDANLSGTDSVCAGINASQPVDTVATIAEIAAEWPAPQSLLVKMASEPYPVDALPSIIRAAVEEVAGFVKAPMAMVGSSALGAISLAVQAHVDVKRAERLSGPVGLYLLTIADSGERKSTCDGFFTGAIREYQVEQTEAAKPGLVAYGVALSVWQAKRAGLVSAIKQGSKDGSPTEEAEGELLMLEGEKPEPPQIPRLLFTDATPEALTYSLGTQWPSGGVVSAEAGIVFGSHGDGQGFGHAEPEPAQSAVGRHQLNH